MKKITLLLATIALMASCQNDDSSVAPIVGEQSEIGFMSNTSRADVISLATLEGDADGFKVYGVSADAPTAWFAGIDGSVNYKNDATNGWGWVSGSPQWPTTSDKYPMSFYALYPADAMSVALPDFEASFTVAATAATQVDLVTATSTAASKPAGGKLPLLFTHSLSKVNFNIMPGAGTTSYVQSLKVHNVGDTDTYDFVAKAWKAATTAFDAEYVYQATDTDIAAIANSTASEGATSALGGEGVSNLMLLPQSADAWDKTVAADGSVEDGLFSMIYRLETTANENAVGYKDAANHPDYDATAHAALNGKPLFVKVGYPLGNGTYTWELGKGYNYNIALGCANSSNGYYLDDVYYDENGDPTDLEVEDKDPGDPVSDGEINFTVDVKEWEETSVGVE